MGKSQTFSNSCAKNCLYFLKEIEEVADGTKGTECVSSTDPTLAKIVQRFSQGHDTNLTILQY